jgi:hypothetical protein
MKLSWSLSLVVVLCVARSIVSADSLELKNGNQINGKFMGGTENEISFQVGSSVQTYNLADIASLKFDSASIPEDALTRSDPAFSSEPGIKTPAYLTIPAGTRISVPTIDGIDSTKNHVGDRFEASLEEPLTVDGNVVVAKGADVYGRLTESKKSGTFTGRSELQLELTGIVVTGRTIGGAAVGSIIGALAGGGKGAGIGAAVGGGAGAGSEVITKGDQVKVPSETLLDFTLQQDLQLPKQ